MTTNGHPPLTDEQIAAKNGYPLPEHGHTCRSCGAPIECEWWVVIHTRRLAQSIAMAAQNLERQLSGFPHPSRRRARAFTPEEAQAALAELGSFRAVARKLGVNSQTIKRAIVPPEQWPTSMRRVKT